MFWGLIMEPGRRYSQEIKKPFHISMAALDVGSSDKEASQIMCLHEERNYLLCTLKAPDMLQCPLDLEFAAGSQISFAINGKANVHLTGYLTDTDEDGLSFGDLANLEEEDDEVEEEEEVETKGKKKKKKGKEINEPPSKKSKLSNGFSNVEDGNEEEEESDDPDFEEESDDDAEEEQSEEAEEEEDDEEEEEEGDESTDEEVEEEEEVVIQQKPTKKEKKNQKMEATEKEQKKNAKSEQSQKGQKQTLKNGVIIEDLTVGGGPPAKVGRFVNVYYEGRLQKNNKMFDSTNKGPGFKFRLGAGEVIKAWDIGLAGMKVGGVRKIICPPHTAYGPKGSPPAIPPNSTLVFTVTLKKVN